MEPRTISEMILIKNPELTHPLARHLYKDPSSERSGGWNFVICKEVLLVSLLDIVLLGDLAFHEVKRAFMLGG